MLNYEFLIRIVLAGVLGSAIGLEREKRFKEAGLRTHFLVAVGSAIFMIISKYAFDDILGDDVVLDPSRVAAQVVSGVGFLGAGMILVQRQSIHGLTTAAGIWATSAIGMAVGGGMYEVGVFGTLLVLIGLEFLKRVFQFAIPESSRLSVDTSSRDSIEGITNNLIAKGINVTEFDVKTKTFDYDSFFTIRYKIEQNKRVDKGDLAQSLQQIDGVMGVKWS